MITVVIPTTNRHKLLRRALQSVGNVPAVVVDDGTESAFETVTQFPHALYTGTELPHSGPSAARNAGIQLCETEYVQFLDDDDYFVDDWLPQLTTELVLYAPDVWVGASHNLDPRYSSRRVSCNYPFTSQLCVRLSVLNRCGGFDAKLRLGEERELLERLTRGGYRIRRIELSLVVKTGDDPRDQLIPTQRADRPGSDNSRRQPF